MATESIGWMGGMLVGSLSEEDLRLFELAVEQGIAYRAYEGAAGFMGLAKVRFLPRTEVEVPEE